MGYAGRSYGGEVSIGKLKSPKEFVSSGVALEIPTSELDEFLTFVRNTGAGNLTVTTQGVETIGGQESIVLLAYRWAILKPVGGDAPGYAVMTSLEQPVNQLPIADFTISTTALITTFTDTSTDADGTIASWAWTFSSGAAAQTAQNPVVTETVDGTYTATLVVTDDLGAVSIAKVLPYTVAAVVGIPEPVFDVAITGSYRLFEAADIGGLVDLVPDFAGNLTSWTSSGAARPTKIATGVGSVLTNGSTTYLAGSSLSELNGLHDSATDLGIHFTIKNDASGYFALNGNFNAPGIILYIASGNLYFNIGNLTADDRSSALLAADWGNGDGTWQQISMFFDKSTNDFFIYVNGVLKVSDLTLATGITLGSFDASNVVEWGKNGAAFSAVEGRDVKICLALGNHAANAAAYATWGTDNAMRV